FQPLFDFLNRRFQSLVRRRRRRRILATDAAELLVVDELLDSWIVAADGALGISADLEFLKTHLQGVVENQSADQRRTLSQDQLDRFGRLEEANQAGQDAQHAALGTAWYLAGWRRFRVQAAVARPVRREEHRRLPIEAEDAAVNVGF